MSEPTQGNGTSEISRFRAVVVAGLRTRQLLRGSKPRIDADPQKRKNTSIAVEEVRRGLVIFSPRSHKPAVLSGPGSSTGEPIPVGSLRHDVFNSFKTDERQ
jgi:DNA-directed RNA polymerase omega subunit